MGRIRPALLVTGAALLALGCLLPVVVLAEPGGNIVPAGLSVADCALGTTVDLQLHDTYVLLDRPGTWPARLVLAAAAALLVCAATRTRGPLWFAGVAFVVAAVWLFLEIGRPALADPLAAESTGWTAYPPLSAVEVEHPLEIFANAWWTWAALAAGALLVAVAGAKSRAA